MFSKHIWCVHQRLSHCPPSARRPVAVQSLNTTPSSTSAFCCRTLARSSTRTIPQHRAPISDILAAAELLTTLKSHMVTFPPSLFVYSSYVFYGFVCQHFRGGFIGCLDLKTRTFFVVKSLPVALLPLSVILFLPCLSWQYVHKHFSCNTDFSFEYDFFSFVYWIK